MAAFGGEGGLGAGQAAGLPGWGVLLPAHAKGSRPAGGSRGAAGHCWGGCKGLLGIRDALDLVHGQRIQPSHRQAALRSSSCL